MNIQFLIFANIFIIIIYVYFTRIYNNKISIDHFILLLAGIIFYWIFPIYAYENKLYIYHHKELYKSINIENIKLFLFFTFLIVISILFSDFSSRKFSLGFSIKNLYYSEKILSLFFWLIFIATSISAYYMKNIFFHGYEMTGDWPFERGWFISGCLSLTTLNVIYSWNKITQNSSLTGSNIFWDVVINKYFISALVFNFLMLSTGNRGYFISFIVSIILIYIYKNKGINIKYFFLLVGIIILFTSFVAIARSIELSTMTLSTYVDLYSLTSITAVFFYEPVNVGVTLLYFLKEMDYNLIEFPYIFLSRFIGIIPSVIFPGKFGLMITPEEIGKSVLRFQGTTHNFVELLINFGLIGTIFFFVFLSVGFNWLKSQKNLSPLYIAASANIPFFFFRSFYDATIKHIFAYSFLLPLLILIISYLYSKYKR